eukprot:6965683-Pyramimonas_sp.AAC.1
MRAKKGGWAPSRNATEDATAGAGRLDELGENPTFFLAWLRPSSGTSNVTDTHEPEVSGSWAWELTCWDRAAPSTMLSGLPGLWGLEGNELVRAGSAPDCNE